MDITFASGLGDACEERRITKRACLAQQRLTEGTRLDVGLAPKLGERFAVRPPNNAVVAPLPRTVRRAQQRRRHLNPALPLVEEERDERRADVAVMVQTLHHREPDRVVFEMVVDRQRRNAGRDVEPRHHRRR